MLIQGSGWAVCFSELLARQKEFHNKHFLIGSGALVPKRQFHMRMSAATRVNSLFLLVENHLPDSVIGGGLMPDVYPLLSVEEGLTFASFGFSCDENAKCIGVSRIVTICFSNMTFENTIKSFDISSSNRWRIFSKFECDLLGPS